MNRQLERAILSAVAERSSCSRVYEIALVGAGGKTTTAHVLGRILAESGFKTVISTTTKMACEAQRCETAEAVCARWEQGEAAVFAHRIDAVHMGGVEPEEWAMLARLADVLIVEADGAKRHGFKVPAAHEPVLLPDTNLALVLYDVHTCGKPLSAIFRADEAKKLIVRDGKCFDDRCLDCELMRFLIAEGYLRNSRMHPNAHIRFGVVANQCDSAALEALGERINEGMSTCARMPIVTFVNAYSEEEYWRGNEN